MGRVLTLVIAPDTEDLLEDSDRGGQRRQPRTSLPGHRGAARRSRSPPTPGWMPQIRVGGDAGAGEVVVLRLHGQLADHASSVVMPFLLPDTPVVAWWPAGAPAVPAQDPLGKLAIRRITDATNSADPLAAIKGRLQGYTAGDTDLAWSRITYWRALLASAVDQPPFEPINSALVSGLKDEPALDILAGWLASRIDGPVRRGSRRAQGRARARERNHHPEPAADRGDRHSEPHRRPEALIPLARREAKECLAEDLRRLDADEIYHEALQGIDKVQYV